jgi:hypothetical protein
MDNAYSCRLYAMSNEYQSNTVRLPTFFFDPQTLPKPRPRLAARVASNIDTKLLATHNHR